MAVTLPDLKVYVGSDDVAYDGLLTDCLAEAQAMVNRYVGVTPVESALRDRAYLEVAADLFHRRNAPNGIANQYDINDGAGAVRIGRDPMAAAYKILRITPW